MPSKKKARKDSKHGATSKPPPIITIAVALTIIFIVIVAGTLSQQHKQEQSIATLTGKIESRFHAAGATIILINDPTSITSKNNTNLIATIFLTTPDQELYDTVNSFIIDYMLDYNVTTVYKWHSSRDVEGHYTENTIGYGIHLPPKEVLGMNVAPFAFIEVRYQP